MHDFSADECLADWFSSIHFCVFLRNNVLTSPNWRLGSLVLSGESPSLPVLMAFLHLGGPKQFGNCCDFCL
jgi:hypothetical protein